MRKLFTSIGALSLCLLFFNACQKAHLPYPYSTGCRITGLKGEILFDDSIIIVYNGKGNPVSMTRTHVGTGAPNYFFRYDNQGRLTDIIGAYAGNETFETWHHYVYGAKGGYYGDLPRTDSVYIFGFIGHGPLPDSVFYGMRYTDFTYDKYGRIIQAIDKDVRPIPDSRTNLYYYNPAGNLISTSVITGGSVDSVVYASYDHKVNPRRTHPIWQLIDRDYSVNNFNKEIAYNSSGLPTIIGGKGSSGVLLGYNFSGELQIEYSCHERY